MISRIIEKTLQGHAPDPVACETVLDAIMAGEVDDAAVAGFLVALRTRPPEAPLLAALARSLRRRRRAVRPRVRPLIDTCGTGGDGAHTFNISTAAALVVAACGGAVAKHGNRSVSSQTGSADVLEAAGLELTVPPQHAARMIDACGFAFLFAPVYHPAMRHVMPARRALGIRTHFNLLGPLCNPALAEYQILGVASPDLTHPMAEALRLLGSRGALVVHCAGMDEFGLHAPTVGHRVTPAGIEPFRLDPRELGLPPAPPEALAGGDAAFNATLLRRVLGGETGPPADCVALNAAAALVVANLAADMQSALEAAHDALRRDAALRVLDRAIESSLRLAKTAPDEKAPPSSPAIVPSEGSFLHDLRPGVEARARTLGSPAPPDPERPSFLAAIAGRETLSLIAEIKRKSPTAGELAPALPAAGQAAIYRDGGAAALSVLTEPDHFGGSMKDLDSAREATELPVLMKDFIRDPSQLAHGAAHGASAALLIVRWLDDAHLGALLETCRDLALDALVECHDEEDIHRALDAGVALIGINNRDLSRLQVDTRRVPHLVARIPRDVVVVAESGYTSPEAIRTLRGRVDAVLVGTALMRSPDPRTFIREAIS